MTTTAVGPSAIPCLICESENHHEAAICAYCLAPMELTHQATKQRRKPSIVSVLGDSNVGKTVYVGMLLDILSKRPDGFEAVPKGVYSVNLQEAVMTHLAARQFPNKTASEPDTWSWAYYQVTRTNRARRTYDLVMPDVAGEALAAEVDHPHTVQVIFNLLQKSSATMLLIDAELAAAGNQHQDFFALKMASYIDDMLSQRPDRKVKRPVAFVLCKSDRCPECFDSPENFVETNLNRLWNMCNARFSNFRFFACSILGGLGYTQAGRDQMIRYPLHVEPRGVLEPFEWVVSQI
jgi:hypothetical protein